MILRKRALKVSQVSKHINIINMHCRKLKFGMLIELSVWHTVVKVHKNNYVSFCYMNFWKYNIENYGGNYFEMLLPAYKVNVFYWDCNEIDILLPAYIVSVFYWDKLGSSENSRLILEVVYISTVSGLHKST